MQKVLYTLLFVLAFAGFTSAQTAPDFTFTDIHGDQHNLNHALEQGYVVLLDFFFVDCPPCQATAPEIQAIHDDYAGKNVIIWSISDRDADAYIEAYKTNAGLTYLAGGEDGGGTQVINLYASNFTFTGFPTFSVVCPDGGITWDVWPLTSGAANLRAAIDACGVVDADPYVAFSTTRTTEVGSLESVRLAPNPIATEGQLQLSLSESTFLSADLFNAQGQRVRNLFRAELPAGEQQFQLNLEGLPAGQYWLRLQDAEGRVSTLSVQKM
ncbi:MAG: redoxin domain-containing protein [Lewinella sp.]|nr:redoxin domain-containing protein [Lewinella sp.]